MLSDESEPHAQSHAKAQPVHFAWAKAEQRVFLSAAGQPISRAELLADVARAGEAICHQPQTHALLHHADRYTFTVWLLALLSAGKTIVLPTNGQPATLAKLTNDDTWQIPEGLFPYSESDPTRDHALSINPETKLIFYTSGSSGEPQPVVKSFRQLMAEVQTLNEQFGNQPGEHPEHDGQSVQVAATVTHQHIYGLLFSVLWPLKAGYPIVRQNVEFMSDWQRLLNEPTILVASPAHLSRFQELSEVAGKSSNIVAIFSSGGPLDEQTPGRFQQALNVVPVEVYGSTETGGVAFRQRLQTGTPWQFFAGVRGTTDTNDCLQITSPHLPERQAWQTQDKIELLADGKFHLLGRVDRVVKIAEKRVSLPELEQRTTEHPWVERCAACIIDTSKSADSDVAGTRLQPALVIELSAAGQQAQQEVTKHRLNQAIRHHLRTYFEPVVLPRKFRYVQSLPYNATGKVTESALQQLFVRATKDAGESDHQ